MEPHEDVDTGLEQALESHIDLTTSIVSAYVSHNSVRAADLPELIASVHSALAGLAGPAEAPAAAAAPPTPAVPIKKSVTDDYIICLEDGKKFRSLKRHIGTVYNLSPEQYREKWGLPRDYPMVAPAYSAIRSRLAKDIGLGQQRGAEETAEAPKRKRAAAK
ncbi:Transcriptional regulatory protein MucR [Beijerinckiaceae bacterium RH AL1]|nr:MucR family transcriptional regulator [Beijerinckiaceae bacterium]VVB42912.1 Transcriptional regulatory protein MucR [Beijerinckiaceae bacterium RH AL8]VVB42923.1 Transcriptional regulatory protein MucR [Beijerinckiaceae bacterium RH CH11]VVC53570.1 Transcriptional regulatory protein MucR [Beijerinckiaceae bacterium RH AL1]